MVVLSQKLALSVRERLLLHLFSLQKYENEFEVPVLLTQAGISQSTGIARPNVSRAVKKMQENNLVTEKLSHIKGHKRQKKVYFLTSAGLVQARELDTSLGRARLKLKTPIGSSDELTVEQLMEKLPNKFNKLAVIFNLDENGYFDHTKVPDLKAGISGEEPTGSKTSQDAGFDFVHIMNPAVEVRHFYGRRRELNKLTAWLRSVQQPFVFLYGIPGIGKTTLALELIRRSGDGNNVLIYGLNDWDNLASVLKELSSFLEKLKKPKLKKYLEGAKSVEPSEAARIIADELTGLPVIIVIDDLQRANTSIISLFSALLPQVQHQTDVKIILLSRKLIKFYDRRHVLLKKTVVELKLEGLDKNSSRELIGKQTLSDVQFAKIYVRTGGHPLYLELLESAPDIDDRIDMFEFVHEEIFSRLTEREQKMLKIASVYRYPVMAEALFGDPELSYGDIDSLVARSYLVRHGINLFDAHDLIRSFFYDRLSKAELKTYHKLASSYYSERLSQLEGELDIIEDDSASVRSSTKKDVNSTGQTGMESANGTVQNRLNEYQVELQFHLLLSGDMESALTLTLDFGWRLIQSGRFDLIMLLDEYDLNSMPEETRGKIMAMKGEILTKLGDIGEALKHLHRSLKLLTGTGTPSEIAHVSTLIGENLAGRGEWKNAETYHHRAQTSLKSIPLKMRNSEDKFALARSYNNSGLAAKKMGEPVKALEFYDLSLNLLKTKKLGTDSDRAALHENMGLLMVEIDELESARDHFEIALALLKRVDDYSGMAKLFATLGDIYVELDDIKTASDFFERGVFYWERAEDVGEAAQTFQRLSQVYTERFFRGARAGSPAKKTSYWDRLQRFFSSVQESDYRRISRLYDRIGALYMHRGYWHKSLEFHEKALKLFEKIRDNRGLAKVYNNLGVIYRSRQEPVKALESYNKSLRYLEQVGDRRGLVITYLNIGRLYERLEKPAESKKAYENCLKEAGAEITLKSYRGLALFGLARQAKTGTSMRKNYLSDAEKIFEEIGDKVNLAEVKKLSKSEK